MTPSLSTPLNLIANMSTSPDLLSAANDTSILKSIPINEEDETCLSSPCDTMTLNECSVSKAMSPPRSEKCEKVVPEIKTCHDVKLTSGKCREVVIKPIKNRTRKEVPKDLNVRRLGDDRDLSQVEAKFWLAKKLNELANNRLNIAQKRQKFVRQKSFEIDDSDIETENDAIVR